MSALPPIFGEGRALGVAFVTASAVGQAFAAGLLAFETRKVFLALHSGDGRFPLESLLLLFTAGAVIAGLRLLGRVMAEKLGQDYAISLRRALFHHLTHMPAGLVANRRSGALALRFVGDLATARNWVGLGIARTISAIVVVPGAALVLVLLNPALAAAASLPILISIALMVILAPWIAPLHRRLRKRRANLAIDTMERVSVAPELLLMGRAKRELKDLNRHGQDLRAAAVRRVLGASALRAVPDLGVAAAAALLLWSAFTTGAPPAEAAAALAVMGILVQPMRDLAGVWDRWCAWRIARAKCETVLSSPRLARSSGRRTSARKGPARLAFKQVTKGGLHGLDATAEAGCKIVIFGPNGAGKSTCLALAAGLEQPECGRVEIDRVDLRELSLSARQKAIIYIGPESPILHGSLRRALTLGLRPRPKDEVVEAMARDFGLGDVLERLGGLDAKVSAGGRNLSSGEARRVHLVRAALAKPRLLLLDDLDDALDRSGRSAIETLIRDTSATVLQVTRNPEIARRAEHLWCLDGGALVEHGPPETILGGDGPGAHFFHPRQAA